jgi:hypothetical protein
MSIPKMFFGGLPTKVEVDGLMLLADAYREGDTIPYELIEAEIKIGRRSNRGASIVSSWKRRMFRENNVLLIADSGKGYRKADPKERMSNSSSLVSAGRRRIMRAATVAASTEAHRLDDEGKKLREHIQAIPSRLRLAELCAPKS